VADRSGSPPPSQASTCAKIILAMATLSILSSSMFEHHVCTPANSRLSSAC